MRISGDVQAPPVRAWAVTADLERCPQSSTRKMMQQNVGDITSCC